MGRKSTTDELEARAFNHGYLIATSNLLNMFGSEVEAEDMLNALGIEWAEVKALGLCEYDLKALGPVYANIRRKEIRAAKAKGGASLDTGGGE